MFPSFHPHSPLIINMSDWHKAACSKVCVVAPNNINRKKKKGRNRRDGKGRFGQDMSSLASVYSV